MSIPAAGPGSTSTGAFTLALEARPGGGAKAKAGSRAGDDDAKPPPPPPAVMAAMVAAEVLAAAPLWAPPGSPSSGGPNWPSQCPPCAAPVTITCLGGHEQREVPCSVACPYSCTRPCGRPLACGASSPPASGCLVAASTLPCLR